VLGLPPWEDPKPLIRDVSLKVAAGEVLSIVGPTGAGKTTLLRILAGLETEFDGQVSLNGDPIEKPDRRIYLMPQAHTLLPWLSVRRNLLFAAARDGDDWNPGDDTGRLLEKFELTDKQHRYPHTLSGGERARVALTCAMIAKPEVLLLDEPFRGVDQVTTEKCQDHLFKWLEETDQHESVVIVSHSISDAVFLGNRVIVVAKNPLRVHRLFETPTHRKRRSSELAKLEEDVFSALMQIAAPAARLLIVD
jgi:ABC-type nitrate/sulfonate/bicarbonate transport system ATPase subunit